MSHNLLTTLILASEEGAEQGHSIPPLAWGVGAGAFAVFLLLVFAVTRLNLDR